MAYLSVYTAAFQDACKQWIQEQGEVLALFRYSYAAGSKSYEFFTTYADLQERTGQLPARTCVTVWGEPLLPLRGIVDDAFIAHSLGQIPEAREWLFTGLDRVVYGKASWFRHNAGMSLAELAEELADYTEERIALGLYPAWSENGGVEVSAVIPDPDGAVVTGTY